MMFEQLKLSLLPLFASLSLIGLTGCSVPVAVPYEPLPRVEQDIYKKAKFNVLPGDVLNYPEKNSDTLVGWSGIIRDIKIEGEGKKRVARFTVEHRYFDWMQNQNGKDYTLELSPDGEGFFATAWPASSQNDWMYVSQFKVGDMMIAYGYPRTIHDMVVGFYPTLTMRGEKPENFSVSSSRYGRKVELESMK
jgi:hypothetical protein